jgi:hypothetical protein
MGVESLSRKMAVVPVASRESVSWERAITKMLEESFSDIRVVYSDRDVATSAKFRRGIFRTHGVVWKYLRNNSKAFLAENGIRHFRSAVSVALEANPGKDYRQFIPGIVNHYNAQPLPNTNVIRSSINADNYLSKLSQIYKTTDPDMLFNVASGGNFTRETERVLFRYKVGDRVLLNRKADYEQKTTAFDKASHLGTYGKTVFTIRKLVLKSNAGLFLVPTYRLEGRLGLYYEKSLIKVPFRT